MRIVFNKQLHIRIRDGVDTKVETVSARWADGDPSHATAHNFPSHSDAARALKTYRYAAHQQG